MEVSSHGIHQKESIAFRRWSFYQFLMIIWIIIPLLQNIEMLKNLFYNLQKSAVLTNVDDNGAVMLQNTVANKRSYALKSYADYKAQILENQLSGYC
jgi:UDP-N-acetylmuramoyl-L-alanyl-D-glutamate--2,6-diaminopimelate ligase